MRKESAIIRKCSAQRTGEPFHYASIEHRFCVAFETHKTGGKLPKGTCRPCNPDF